MLVNILAAFAVISVVIAAVTFVLYGRARMQEQEEKEKFFLRIHYAALFLLFLVGIIFMFFMIETET